MRSAGRIHACTLFSKSHRHGINPPVSDLIWAVSAGMWTEFFHPWVVRCNSDKTDCHVVRRCTSSRLFFCCPSVTTCKTVNSVWMLSDPIIPQFWRKSRTAYVSEHEPLADFMISIGAYTPASQEQPAQAVSAQFPNACTLVELATSVHDTTRHSLIAASMGYLCSPLLFYDPKCASFLTHTRFVF
jgi:hypothetical protein